MHKGPKLNGGSISAYTPIGEDGRPVWQYAGNFRQEIIRSKALGTEFADFLAIPEFTDQGRHVDWFCPFEVKENDEIVMWQAASEEEKSKAYRMLQDFERRLTMFGQDLERRALTGDAQLFSHFITGTSATEKLPAIHFPDLDCIYIVGGRPVITFWGFIKPGDRLNLSPFASLKPAEPVTQAAAGNAAGTAGAGGATAAAAIPWWRRWWWLWLLPLLLLLLWLLWWLFWPRPVTLPLTALTDDEEEILVDDDPLVREKTDLLHAHDGIVNGVVDGDTAAGDAVVPDDDDATAADGVTDDAALPDDGAQDPAAEDAEVPAEDAPGDADQPQDQAQDQPAADEAAQDPQNQDLPEPNAAADDAVSDDQAAAPDASQDGGAQNGNSDPSTDANGNLVLDPKALGQGDLSGLDGRWNTSSGLIDSATGKPVSVKYDFKNGNGQAEISRSDGVKCSTATGGSSVSGALEIAGGNARCSDGSTVQLPKIKCVPGKDGKAKCSGIYDAGNGGKSETVDMELYK